MDKLRKIGSKVVEFILGPVVFVIMMITIIVLLLVVFVTTKVTKTDTSEHLTIEVVDGHTYVVADNYNGICVINDPSCEACEDEEEDEESQVR